jgi:putative methionine-R-sulfoxide reductase with GAF domain
MAEPVRAQDRLDKIVVLIAANMVAEVCSVYVLRVDATLELYATEGLNREAVHQTVMQSEEGLVGLVASEASAVNLSDAQSHPAFSYRPETGEEIYHSFLGVPILRAGNTLGVLVVQNRARRTYSEEEVEALQTTAMVLAEMIASGELSALARPGAEPAVRRSLRLQGSVLNEGIALGHVVLHEPRVIITNFIADDVSKERARLETAKTATFGGSANFHCVMERLLRAKPLTDPNDRLRRPRCAGRRCDLAAVERVGCPVGRHAGKLGEHWPQAFGAVGSGVTVGSDHGGVAEHHTASLGGCEPGAGAVGYHAPLLLGERRVNVQGERVNVRTKLGDHERHLVRHQAGNEGHITG